MKLKSFSKEETHVFTIVLLQSFCGLSSSGLYYGWASIADAIALRFNPDFIGQFKYQHGVFGAVILLCLGALPMPLVQYLIVSKKLFTEYQVQLAGLILCPVGLVLGGISLQYRLLWLYYFGCAFIGGVGGLCLFRRLVFNHQLWFKHINQQNMGSALFGFSIGVWTVVFFLISVPILKTFPVHKVLYIYSAIIFPLCLFPVFTIVELHDQQTIDINEDKIKDTETKNRLEKPKALDRDCPGIEITNIQTHGEDMMEHESNREVFKLSLTSQPPPSSKNSSYVKLSNTIEANGTDEDSIDTENRMSDDEKLLYEAFKYNIKTGPIKSHSKDNQSSDHTNDDPSNDIVALTPTVAPTITPIPTELKDSSKNKNGSNAWNRKESPFDFDLTVWEILSIPQTYMITVFFAALLTPGWGIKLGSYALLTNLFPVSLTQAALITSVYVSFYAFGRLLSGFTADTIGLVRAFDIIIIGMFCCLIVLPHTTTEIEHNTPSSSGLVLFVALLWGIGLLYGGSIALFYSVVFEIYGARNYKSVFSITISGFAISVIVGGLSSAYSFSQGTSNVSVAALSARWFYAMAGGLLLALVFLHSITPVDYRILLQNKVKKIRTLSESSREQATQSQKSSNRWTISMRF